MNRKDLTSNERAILEQASCLWSAIGHDICMGEDGCYEDEEVASVLQDRMRDWLREEGYANLVPVWDSLDQSKKHAICMMAQ